VHPTQLYEAALGAVAAGVAALVLRRRRRRDGLAFAAFLLVYAFGRFLIELLRGDHDRGHALGLSTSQWVSVAIVAALAAAALRARQGDGGGFAASARA
jgi:phosphatidylglycerol:prolipoprotein diacylglycerol transferase